MIEDPSKAVEFLRGHLASHLWAPPWAVKHPSRVVRDYVSGHVRTAVFSTSEIQGLFTRGEVVSYAGNPDGSVDEFKTTGNLERALGKGYTVFVGSTRSRLGNHDTWWAHKVGGERIFLADPEPDGFDALGPFRNVLASSGWVKLFEALGLEWPTDEDGRPSFWTSVVPTLRDYGIVLGRDFKPRPHPLAGKRFA